MFKRKRETVRDENIIDGHVDIYLNEETIINTLKKKRNINIYFLFNASVAVTHPGPGPPLERLYTCRGFSKY